MKQVEAKPNAGDHFTIELNVLSLVLGAGIPHHPAGSRRDFLLELRHPCTRRADNQPGHAKRRELSSGPFQVRGCRRLSAVQEEHDRMIFFPCLNSRFRCPGCCFIATEGVVLALYVPSPRLLAAFILFPRLLYAQSLAPIERYEAKACSCIAGAQGAGKKGKQ
jgi:hypothetical protein